MWKKIKSLLRAVFASWQGVLGAAMTLFALYLSAGFFTGTANIQSYFRNRAALDRADAKIAALQTRLDATNHHIDLIWRHSPDFVSEMALRHLNLGDPEIMILKK
jgi:cell division protein FtsB